MRNVEISLLDFYIQQGTPFPPPKGERDKKTKGNILTKENQSIIQHQKTICRLYINGRLIEKIIKQCTTPPKGAVQKIILFRSKTL